MLEIEPKNVVDIISCSICYPSGGNTLIVPAVARAALYYFDSSFWWKEL